MADAGDQEEVPTERGLWSRGTVAVAVGAALALLAGGVVFAGVARDTG